MIVWHSLQDYEQAIQDPESYHQITELRISYPTTSLPELPTSLKYLYCYQNQLTSLPELPSSLNYLNLKITESTLYATLGHGLSLPEIAIPTPEITQIEAQIPKWLTELNSGKPERYQIAYQEIIQAKKLLQISLNQPLEITL